MHILHLVSHTHWDREWYLPFQQFRLKLVHLIDNLLVLLESDQHYKHFMLDGQTIVLDDYLLLRPEREETIRGHVQSGRLLIGPWHILPDEFLVSPEALIRNLLEGDYTARRFGPKMMVGYIPDPFGHIGQLPQVFRGFGLETTAFRRGLSDEACELWWEAPDGSRVFTVYLRDGYDNAANLPTSDPAQFVSEVRRLRDSLARDSSTSHILLMHGTDHMEPQPDTTTALARVDGQLDGDHLIHSTLPAYIAAVQSAIRQSQAAIPVLQGELRSPKRHHLLPGVLSARMWIKQRNHICETLLEKWAEPFSAWATLVEREAQPHNGYRRAESLANPTPILRQAWRMLMECHPHDSICGCSVDQVHDEMRPRFDQAEQVSEEITRHSLQTLAEVIDTRSPSSHSPAAILVFNPVAGPRTDRVWVSVGEPFLKGTYEIVDETGRVLPYEVAKASTTESAVQFIARNVPGYGYRTFWLRPAVERHFASVPSTSRTIENEFFVVEAVPADGTLIVKDRRTGAVYPGLNRFMDGGDAGDEYNYSPPETETPVSGAVQSVRAERGAARQSIEIAFTLQVPAALSEDRQTRSTGKVPLTITTRVILLPGVPRVDIETEVNNPARDHRLRVHFPAPVSVDTADHDGHFEVVRRPIGLPASDDSWVEQPRPEVPQRAFTDVSDDKVGLMIANRGLPEVEALRVADGSTEIALTLLRCVGWLSRDDFPMRRGHAGPMLPTPGAQMIGQWAFDYSIIPHTGCWQSAFREAYAFNVPLRAVVATVHAGGGLSSAAAFVRAVPETFVISAVKEAEEGQGWIVRGYNIGAEAINVTLTPWKRFTRAARVTLAEEVTDALEPAADGSLTFATRGHEIVTIRFG